MQVNYPHLLPINISKSSWIKFLQIKKYINKNKDSDESDSKTVIVTNLSSSCSKDDIFEIFKSFGNIENITLDSKENNNTSNKSVNNNKLPFAKGGYALITFENAESVDKVIKNNDEMISYGKSESFSEEKNGLKKWFNQWKSNYLINQDNLKAKCHETIARIEARNEEIKRLKEELSKGPDDDGWTVVTKRGRKRTHGNMDSTVAATAMSQDRLIELKKKHDQKSFKVDFYQFQRQENKRQKLLELQKKFEEDKKRIAKMRQGRKFNPLF